ncbi:choline dehydrogenase-like flavoprotein [Saccharopolyspora erythraea NRRL 2338]|uniref:Glucose-methanol-choline oxidoreductase n=2 Tax=Saccharopolyspora erythraea TaxID=1836 RepID=A4FHP5_SACEN|nr:GMC family oxidoreductase [Saccharopolyspora erythraea]EQD86820.1 glucose-methanol-choline oxidoreductase [Saccharopolyspora erythraea D]PFG97258.1 choline dehydrogenase-like flavoprotein [Saccharopolyspora erythraea NRRL 2338]QRK87453.1 GMC family oxidoreductase [Saccharopolyspora erythraea]CAM03570.1 glucose-methanol-choline oxidoreductase [Saccharopolyspora erythraea NRRL 2338]
MNASRYADRHRYDAVVVGSGVYGSLVAKRLGERGWRVLVLEAGTGTTASWEGYTEAVRGFRAALLKSPNSPYLSNPAAPSPDATDPDGYFVQNPDVSPYGSDYLRAMGGTTLHWEGVVPRMHEHDFFGLLNYGHGRDWPFSSELDENGLNVLHEEDRKDVQKYYRQAEHELGVCGDAKELEHSGMTIPDYVYPMKALPQSYMDQVISRRLGNTKVTLHAEKSFELKPTVVPAPQARNGIPNPDYDNGRGYRPKGAAGLPNYGERCVGNSSCIPICPVQAKYTPLRTHEQFDHERVTVATRSIVTRVLFNTHGRATGVEYQVYDDPRSTAVTTHYVEGSMVVLAAHAIENAKLLLASGVKNDNIGRNLMDHPLVVTQGLMPEDVGPHRGPAATSFIDVFRDGPWRNTVAPFRIGLFNWGWGFKADSFSREVRALVERGTLKPTEAAKAPVIGRALRDQLAKHMPRQFQLEFMLEQPPDPNNRVTIDPAHRDRLGNYRPVIAYGIDKYVRAGAEQAVAVSGQLFAALGAEEWNFTLPQHKHRKGDEAVIDTILAGGKYHEILGARHGAGTHIMGDDVKTSVVDSYQCSHDHPNLYAVGCGSLCSVGTSNPTLTGAMLALRSADQIHDDLLDLNRPVTVRAPGHLPAAASPRN